MEKVFAEVDLTVAELFGTVNLSPRGPVKWGTEILEAVAGVYVVARVAEPRFECVERLLQFKRALIKNLDLDMEYEEERWFPSEPIVYVGQTEQTIQRRINAFYRHKCGDKSPHAGGQVAKLLDCDLWIYWAPANNPRHCERTMLSAFKAAARQEPFANWDGQRRRGRVQYAK